MARKKKLTPRTRLAFASSKSLSALKWIVTSGVATYALMELSKVLDGLQLSKELALFAYMIVNVMVFAIAKYIEGENK